MKKFFSKLSIFVFLMLALPLAMSAQKSIKGTVTDEGSKETLIGASVVIKGTTTGTSTEYDGTYTISANEGDVIVFSYTGYITQEITVGSEDVIDVALLAGQALEEVVVIGYGTVKKSDLTGAVAKIGEDDFNKGVIVSPEQLLEGRTAGVQIVSSSGAPGATASINIRGNSSIRSGNQPLIVLDGIQLDNRSAEPGGDVSQLGRSQGSNPLGFIDPNEIESIEVLKDASATAIYGSRGANGVIIITTKKGRKGDPTLEYNVQQGFSSVLKKPEYLDAAGYRSALSAEGLGTANDLGANVDAFDEILQTGYTNSHSLSVGGGSDKFSYRAFASYLDQDGIIVKSGLTKITGGLKSQFKFFDNDRLTIDLGLNASKVKRQSAPISDDAGFEGSLIGAALQWNPTESLLNEDGSFNQAAAERRNPLAMSNYLNDNSDINRFIGNLGATLKIVDGLSYKFNLNLDNARGERRISANPALNFQDILDRGQAIVGNNQLGSTQITHTLNYAKDLNDNFSLNALVGYEYLKYTNRGSSITARDLAPDFDNDYTDILGSAPATSQTVSSFHDPDVELQSYFARAIFNVQDKYLFTGTLRYDGSSKVGSNNTYGLFPSFSAAWNIAKEGFLPEAVNDLKLRVGWGATGNQEFPAGAAQEYFTYQDGALTLNNNNNPDLTWETSKQFNVGLDYAFADYRITGSIDYFRKSTDDLILFVPAAQPNPATNAQIYRNVDGNIINSGIELGLNGELISKENFRWGAGINLSFLSNEVRDFGTSLNTGAINGQGLTGAFAQKIENGQSLFSYFLPVWVGIDDEGFSIYEDPVNGGTTRIATVSSVKQFVGDPLPDVLLGFTTDLNYKGFDVILNMSGAFGYQIYNNTANAVFVKGNLATGRNITSDMVGNGESTNNSYPASTRYLENGDHVRLSNLTLGYTFDNLPGWIKGLRVSVTGQNLLLFTSYSGFDPVVNTNKEIEGIPSFGIEYTPYPTSRTFLLGVNVKF